MNRWKLLLAACGFLLLLSVEANSATVAALSPEQSDVQAAVNAANTGDTVSVPAGSATWSSSVNIPNDKKITLQGRGMDSTIITLNATAITMNESGSRVIGFGFILPSAGVSMINVKGRGWRIDHCRFNNITGGSRVSIYANGTDITTAPAGLVDNNDFINGRVMVDGLATFNKMSGIWAAPLNLGTDDAVYVEDNTFTRNDYYTSGGLFRNAIDANRGGKYVFRYNKCTDTYLEAHSLQAQDERATRKWEIYNNEIITTTAKWAATMRLRGGTGVVFNNTFKGQWYNYILLDNHRSCSGPDNYAGVAGICNGESYYDGNREGASGYPCRDQIGRSTDQWHWLADCPASDCFPTEAGPEQELDPAYFWNNKWEDGSDFPVDVALPSGSCLNGAHIVRDRDYYVTSGVTKPGYAPYTYPHPLRAEGAPAPPSNLTIRRLRVTNGLDVTLKWNAGADIAGYRIYYDLNSEPPYDGQGAFEGSSYVNVNLAMDENPDPAVVEYTLHGLTDNQIYYFAVTAYGTGGSESIYSNEVDNDSNDDGIPDDVVAISRVVCNYPGIEVVATSSDQPQVTLTAEGYGSLDWKSWLNFYRNTFAGVVSPPPMVTVRSSGGGSDEVYLDQDVVTIGTVTYQDDSLLVTATSSEQPNVQLTAEGFGNLEWKSWLSLYRKTFYGISERPASVTVYSSGGGQATRSLPQDVVTIRTLTYDEESDSLLVIATSSDQPNVQLTADGFGNLGWKSWLSFYRNTFYGISEKPASVTVYSSGGGSATGSP